jgi:ubiquinone/menaquinone biosynthesis C-methylase UbiE
MDRWKYFAITHRDHLICNPTSSAKLTELVNLLPLRDVSQPRVLDIACGKGELLMQIVEHHDASGVGVDLSPFEAENARASVAARGLSDRIEIIHGDGADYPAQENSFDLAMCIGATWVWENYAGTLDALKRIVRPGGVIAVGEPYFTKEPDPAYLAAEPDLEDFGSHADNVQIAQDSGLDFVYAMVSNADDWDRYEGLQTRAAQMYAREHRDDPDVKPLLEKRRSTDEAYFKWGRETLGWAIYLFLAP